jgi:hypothetical protein
MIQRAYLEAWATTKSQVRVWDKREESVQLRGLKQAAVIDLYNHPEHIEQGFWAAELDIQVIRRWAIAQSAEALRETDAGALGRWANMALLRHRYARFAGQAEIPAVLLMDDGTIRRGTGSDGIAIQKMLTDAAHDGINTRAGAPIEGPPSKLDLSTWARLAVAPVHSGHLLTGDAMVSLFPGADGPQAGAAGLLLPLTPSRLLIGARFGAEFQFGDLEADAMDLTDPADPSFLRWVSKLADLSNENVAGASQRFVVSTPDSEVLGVSAGLVWR